MREIKFRAWTGYEMIEPTIEGHENVNNYLNGLENLMQYTGLKDKNGKEIYEGDIVKYKAFTEDGELKEMIKGVFFDVDFGCFMLGTEECMWNLATDDNKEIKGNIRENPELLSIKDTN